MDNKICRKTLSVKDTDWYIPESTLDRASYLIAYLMKQYNIDIDHVIRHYDVSKKNCPRPLVGDDINEYYGISGNQKWQEFKQMIQERVK
jgi:N-acetylmuramoyl-L-alanine amidase CwlA